MGYQNTQFLVARISENWQLVMKKVRLPSFNIDEDEAELFLSLKNAFSNLGLEEHTKGTDSEASASDSAKQIPNIQIEFSDHEKIAEEISPNDLASNIRTAFRKWEEANTPNPVLPMEQLFAEIETEMICATEAVEYMVNVLGSSQKTVETLGKITDEYTKGWSLVEDLPDIRYKYCLMADKLGAKWLDALLEFSQLSVENRTEWLNKFMRNWSYANSDKSPPSPSSAFYDEEAFFMSGEEELSAVGNEVEHSLKRGRYTEMDDTPNAPRLVESEPDMHKRLRWEFVKNMQLMGSMRFELCKKCGMKEECLKIAQQMDDREKIVESRLMARDSGDDALDEAMNSLLHL